MTSLYFHLNIINGLSCYRATTLKCTEKRTQIHQPHTHTHPFVSMFKRILTLTFMGTNRLNRSVYKPFLSFSTSLTHIVTLLQCCFKRLRGQLVKLPRQFSPCWELKGEEIPRSSLLKKDFSLIVAWLRLKDVGLYVEGC